MTALEFSYETPRCEWDDGLSFTGKCGRPAKWNAVAYGGARKFVCGIHRRSAIRWWVHVDFYEVAS